MTTHERDDDATTMFAGDAVELTAAGRARRDAMLPLLLGAQKGRVRRRRAGRAAAVFAIVALGGSAAYVGATRGTAGGASRIADSSGHGAPTPPSVEAPVLLARFVRADMSILDRVTVRRGAAAPVIGDDELAELLREAGREAGIVRIGGRTVLASELTPPAATGTPAEPSGRASDRAAPAAG